MASTDPASTSPKVTAAASGGGSAGAAAILLVWVLTANGIEVPAEVATALGVLISTLTAAGAAYLKRDPLRGSSDG